MSVATVSVTGIWILAAIYLVVLVRDVLKYRGTWDTRKMGYNLITSFITNFFDCLGIGSFATATVAWKFNKSVRDDLIPGTLNVAFAIPMCVQATIFVKSVNVDPLTMILMIAASMVGSICGAKIMSKLDIRKVRIIIGIALCIVAVITLCRMNAIGLFGMIGTALKLSGMKLVIGVAAIFILGVLMTAGIGLYAPCMALVLMLGMSVDAAFPIMMGASAYLCLSCGIIFVKEGKYQRAQTIPMLIVGAIGALIAGLIVKSLPLTILTYLVCVVMVICSVTFFRDAFKKGRTKQSGQAAEKEKDYVMQETDNLGA